MLSWWIGAVALAQADVEVIVYDDLFARWDDTRWHVEAELVTPLGTWLAADANRAVTSYAFQLRAIFGCDKDAVLSKKKLEVRCTIEDLSLQASTHRHGGSERAQEVAQGVLDGIDAMLTGAEVQLQVDAKGGVTSVDLEGLTASNERERSAHEALRQIAGRVIAGYHLRVPDQAQRPGQVIERNSLLMEVPSLRGTQGSTTWVHTVSPWNAYNLVQSLGQGTVVASVPEPRAPQLRSTQAGRKGTAGISNDGSRATIGAASSPGRNRLTPLQGHGAMPLGAAPEVAIQIPLSPNRDGGELGFDITYTLSGSSVALFERTTGVLTERVWTVDGEPTAGSMGGGFQSIPFRNVGRLRILGDDEHPDLGATRQVAPPGWDIEGLERWAPLVPAPPG